MRRNSQRFMALALSMVVVMGSFIRVYATDSEPETATESEAHQTPETGTEDIGGKEEIVQVILPTSAVEIFDFILDPQELIQKTNGAAYGGKTFEEGATLFFERSDGKTETDYTSDSNAVVIANRGTTPVDVMVNAHITVTMAEGLVMTDDREFIDDERPSLYLALTDGENTVPITFEEGAGIQVVLPPAMDAGEEASYSFWLTGACNKNGDWLGLGDMGIDVTVTWKVLAREEETAPENEEEGALDDVEKATPSNVEQPAGGEGGEATPSDATASDVDKDVNETPEKATASDADMDVNKTAPKATASEAHSDSSAVSPQETGDKASRQSLAE